MTTLARPHQALNGKPSAVPADRLWRLSVAQYHAMVRLGVLTENDPVELLNGLLVLKMSKNPPHRVATGLTREALEQRVPAGWYVDSQEPITTADSEPEPDVAVIRGSRRDYLDRHPSPADVGLAVEVGDATLPFDRTTKKAVYAAAGIVVYWIVNLVEGRVEVYTEPTGPAAEPDYGRRQDYGPGEEVPLVLDGREVGRVPVRELLP